MLLESIHIYFFTDQGIEIFIGDPFAFSLKVLEIAHPPPRSPFFSNSELNGERRPMQTKIDC